MISISLHLRIYAKLISAAVQLSDNCLSASSQLTLCRH